MKAPTLAEDPLAAPTVPTDELAAALPPPPAELALAEELPDDDADPAIVASGAGCLALSCSRAAMSHHERMLHAATSLLTAAATPLLLFAEVAEYGELPSCW